MKVARLDASAARSFKQECERAWGDDVKKVVIDMEAVGFIDSSGLGVLLSIYKNYPQARPVCSCLT
ncbi:MAG: STAS domain-containing protein [Candidatus Synoicihabitans palmerolidicus]|nr:STAS domain-containing protein [Candidatus Synoicihabitans palmerolidicus]